MSTKKTDLPATLRELLEAADELRAAVDALRLPHSPEAERVMALSGRLDAAVRRAGLR